MSDDGYSLPPRLLGDASKIIKEASPREDVDPLRPRAEVATVTLTDPDQIAALALAALMAREVVRAGGTRLSERPIDRALEHLWRVLDPADRLDLEIDAHTSLEWLARAFGAPIPAPRPPPVTITPDASHERVATWAIEHGEDLNIELWDTEAGSLDALRVTPIRLEAGHYLRVFDYKRGDTRVLRLHHLSEIAPARGWPRPPDGPAAPPLPIDAYSGEDESERKVTDEPRSLELPLTEGPPAALEPDHPTHADASGQFLMFDDEEE